MQKVSCAVPRAMYASDEAFSTRLICKYNEDGSIEFLDTMYDVVENVLSTALVGDGTYYVMDVKNLFDELGLVMPSMPAPTIYARAKVETTAAYAGECCHDENCQQSRPSEVENVLEARVMTLAGRESSVVAPISAQGAMAQADIVFIIDTTGSMGDEIRNVKNNVNAFVDHTVLIVISED